MTKTINIELLDLLGEKAFVDTMTCSREAMVASTTQIVTTAYAVIANNQIRSNKGAYRRAFAQNDALTAAGTVLLAKGLREQGERGLKLAAREVYASVFCAAGLDIAGLFKDGIDAPSIEQEQFVAEAIYGVLTELLGVSKSDIAPTSLFVQDLGADSINKLEILMAVEDELAIEISDDQAEGIHTVQDAIDVCLRLVPEKS